MTNQDTTRELHDLIAATKEHFQYIKELGVESIESAEVTPAINNQSPAIPTINPAPSNKTAAAISRSQQHTGGSYSPPQSLFGELAAAATKLSPSTETFEAIWADVGDCRRCPLHQKRTNVVHTEGNQKARLMFVGEAPGADEDIQARPFVGKAGQLLNKIIDAIGFKREEVLIGNVNRCRPPGNRPPTTEEAEACRPFLLREIAAVQPEVIVVLGNTAIKNLLEAKEGVTKLRGKFHDYKGIKVMPTYHPAYLLRDPSKKRETWEDLKLVREYLDRNVRE
jgi:DNA polymerase